MWALEELGLSYDLVVMPFPPRFEYEGYLDINPLGTVPTFIDGDTVMTESTGICQYLVERYGSNELGLDKKDPEYGDYLTWLYRSDATLLFLWQLSFVTLDWSRKNDETLELLKTILFGSILV